MKQYAPGKEPQFNRDEDKLQPAEIEVKGGFLGWLDNFWFYHKWKVIVIAASVLLFVICAVQMCGNVTDDITVMYAGSTYLTTVPNYTDILDTFEDVLPSDFNGDGEKRVEFAAMNIYSEAQVDERKALIGKGEDLPPINTYINTQEHTSYSRVMQTGEYSLCLLERWLYDEVAKGVFCKLSDTLGYQPEYAIDSYAVYLRDTEFYKANEDTLSVFPEDTVLCLRMPNSFAGKGAEAQYARSKETFIAILDYKTDISE